MNDIVERLDQAADEVPEELSALLIEAADTIRMLRELVTVHDDTWLEGVEPKGKALGGTVTKRGSPQGGTGLNTG
jgi:hypothetical protein